MKVGDLVKLTTPGRENTVPENVRLLIVPCLVLRAVKAGDLPENLKRSYGDADMLIWELLTREGTKNYWPVCYTHTYDSSERFFEVVSK